MICWSCQKVIPDTAERCPYCEAQVFAEPTEDEKTAAESVLSSMDQDQINELRDAFAKSATGEEFVNRIMIGDCPTCGGSETGDCENDPEIDDPCVARCFACGQLWCPDCGELFKDNQFADHDCPAWEGMDFDDDDSDEAD
jgi:hypothetical protein